VKNYLPVLEQFLSKHVAHYLKFLFFIKKNSENLQIHPISHHPYYIHSMDFQVLQDQLLSLLKDNKLEDLFLEFDTKLARESDLQSLYLMIRNRYHRIKLDTTQGIISRQDENLEENKLVKDLHGIILMM